MPVQLSVQVKKAKIVRKGLENLRSDIRKISASRLFALMEKARQRVIKYPAAIATSKYIRTFVYLKAWRILRNPGSGGRKIAGYSLKGRAVQKGRDYTKYVSGKADGTGQAKVHSGRWELVRDATDWVLDRAPKAIQQEVTIAARRRNLT